MKLYICEPFLGGTNGLEVTDMAKKSKGFITFISSKYKEEGKTRENN